MLKGLKKRASVALATMALMVCMVSQAFAVGTADTAVVGTFTTISDNVVATIGAVAPYAIAILAVFLGFRYGKRIFKALSNG